MATRSGACCTRVSVRMPGFGVRIERDCSLVGLFVCLFVCFSYCPRAAVADLACFFCFILPEFTVAMRKIFIAALGVLGNSMERGLQMLLTMLLVFVVVLMTSVVQPYGGGDRAADEFVDKAGQKDTNPDPRPKSALSGFTRSPGVMVHWLEIGSLVALFLTLWAGSN